MESTSLKRLEVALALGGLVLTGAGGTARPLSKTAPVSVEASQSEVDYATHHLILHNVVISQEDLKISAARADATGLNFQDSRWTFTGDVHLTSALRGNLQSDQAVVEFRNNQIETAVATGQPAQFEQTASSSGVLARGHADTIRYAVAAGTVRLTTDAWLKYGENEITGPDMVYDIKAQRLVSTGGRSPAERIHITIVPRKGTSSGPGAALRAAHGAAPKTPRSAGAKPPDPGATP